MTATMILLFLSAEAESLTNYFINKKNIYAWFDFTFVKLFTRNFPIQCLFFYFHVRSNESYSGKTLLEFSITCLNYLDKKNEQLTKQMKKYDSYLSDSDRTSMFNGLFSKITKKEETHNPSHKDLSDDSEEKGLITSYADKLKDGFFSSLTKTRSVLAQSQDQMNASMNFAKNLPYIILLLVAGSFFLMIALFYLPAILIWPSKFSFSFAIASICFLSAIALVRDPKTFLRSLLKAEKIKYSAAYAISLVGTFYFSMVSRSFVFSLVFAIAQVTLNLHLPVN